MSLHEQLENFLAGLRGLLLLLRRVQILADFLPQFGESRDSARFACRILHEFVVQLGQLLFLDALNLDCVVVGFSGELGIGIVLRIARLETFRFAGSRAAKVFGEAFERFFGADVAEDVVRLDRIAAAHWRAHQFDQSVVAVFRRAAFDGNKRGGTLAHFFERLVHLRVADFIRVHLDLEILVIAQLEFGKDFEDRAEFQRLAFFEFDLVHFGARDRDQFFFVERFFEIFRHERLHHFALNVFGEAAANQRDGRLARTESGNARHARDVARHFFGRFLHVLGRNFQLDFTLAGCFCHGEIVRGQTQANLRSAFRLFGI